MERTKTPLNDGSWLPRAEQLLTVARRYGLELQDAELSQRIADAHRGLVVAVVGEGKFGKSSLVNALVGLCLSKVDFLPATRRMEMHAGVDDGDDEHAIVFSRTDPQGKRLTINDARRLCQADDGKSRDEQQVLETISCHRAFLLGQKISIIDTQGLDQDLHGDESVAHSIVRGLENTHQVVREVWTSWYNRADVILWCVPASSLPSKSTHKYLRTLTEKYSKPIVPVLTKCDRPEIQSRLNEVRRQFDKLFRNYRGLTEPFLTACPPPGENSQFGVVELRTYVRSLGEVALAKSTAAQAATEDAARNMVEILHPAGANQVANLRAIASIADGVATRALQEYEEAGRTIAIANERFSHRVTTLERELPRIELHLRQHWARHRSFIQLVPNSEQRAELQKLADDGITAHLRMGEELDRIDKQLREIGAHAAEQARIASRDPSFALRQLGIAANGERWASKLEITVLLPDSLSAPATTTLPAMPAIRASVFSLIRDFFGSGQSSRPLRENERAFLSSLNDWMSDYSRRSEPQHSDESARSASELRMLSIRHTENVVHVRFKNW